MTSELSRRSFQLTEGDIEILKLAFDFRLLQIDHLIVLTQRHHKAIHRRLLKLIEHHYLTRLKLPWQKHLYLIGREAMPILVDRGSAPKELIEWRLRHHELKELFLKHMLMVVDVHTALALATAASDIRLLAWKQGSELYDRVTLREAGKHEQLPVRPDAFFRLENTRMPPEKNRISFFLEADRSTTTHERFLKKITAYWHYFQQGGHTRKYGIKTFRVVTVTLNKERAANLCKAAEQVIPKPARKFYLFTSFDRFSLTNAEPVLGNIFITPHDGDVHRLMPMLAADGCSV
jgi:hypothetical protein